MNVLERNQNNINNNPLNRDANRRNRNSYAMSSTPPPAPWFQGAPLSKLITFIAAGSYLAFEMRGLGGSSIVSLDWQAVLFEGQIYRLFMFSLTFASIGEMLLGLGVLCPLMRRFEREMGTRKFSSFLLFKSLPISTILLCLLLELSDLTDNANTTNLTESPFAPGPYPHIGALLYLYHTYTPKQHPRLFGILGIDFSEKAFTYGFVLQASLSNGWSSTLPIVMGYFSGWIASSPLLQEMLGDKWDVVPLPGFLLRFAENVARATGLDVLSYAPTTGVVGLAGALGRRGRTGEALLPRRPGHSTGGVPPPVIGGGVPAVPQPARFETPPPPPPPSEEAVGQLTAMGFERDAVVRALQATDNNVAAAANRLLSGS